VAGRNRTKRLMTMAAGDEIRGMAVAGQCSTSHMRSLISSRMEDGRWRRTSRSGREFGAFTDPETRIGPRMAAQCHG
jgi:hypothetical protein